MSRPEHIPIHDHSGFNQGGKLRPYSAIAGGIQTITGGSGAPGAPGAPGSDGSDGLADLGWFNVEDYGAVHDGVTDDTSAIQDAIDACHAAGGGTIFFPLNLAKTQTIYQIDGALQDTGTFNSQLEIPQRDLVRADGAVIMRFLGPTPTYTNNEGAAGVVLRSSWNGSISGNPAIISAGTHDSMTINWTILHFENIEIRAHADPKLTAIDATKAGGVRFYNLTVSTYHTNDFDIPLPADWTVPANSNAIGVDFPRGFDDLYSGGDGLNIQGFYTGFRPGEQFTALGVTIGFCRQAVDFRGGTGSPSFTRHAIYISRLETFFCPRGVVFSGDERWVWIAQASFEHEDSVAAAWSAVYDIDDASNYGRGFIGWHVTDWTTGPGDSLLVNGGTGLSLFGAYAKRWKLTNVVDVPIGTDPSTNPANGFRLYAASATGKPTTRSSAGTVTTIMREGDTAGGDLSGTYPNPSVTDDSHSHTTATLPAATGIGDHEHMVDLFTGDGATTIFELTDEPIDPEAVVAFVAGAETAVTMSGTLNTTATFGVAPGGAARVIVMYPAVSA